jgi:hypothetical protein
MLQQVLLRCPSWDAGVAGISVDPSGTYVSAHRWDVDTGLSTALSHDYFTELEGKILFLASRIALQLSLSLMFLHDLSSHKNLKGKNK